MLSNTLIWFRLSLYCFQTMGCKNMYLLYSDMSRVRLNWKGLNMEEAAVLVHCMHLEACSIQISNYSVNQWNIVIINDYHRRQSGLVNYRVGGRFLMFIFINK